MPDGVIAAGGREHRTRAAWPGRSTVPPKPHSSRGGGNGEMRGTGAEAGRRLASIAIAQAPDAPPSRPTPVESTAPGPVEPMAGMAIVLSQ